MHEELASIRGVVSLSPTETLDSAESLLSRLGYDTKHRTDYFLTAQRPASLENTEQDSFTVTVTVSPHAKGGVRVAVRGDDREGMQAHQKEWAEWADSLPKQGPSARLPTTPVRTAPQRVEETTQVEVIFDRPDQLAKIEAGLLPGEEIEAVFDTKGGGTGFVGITSKRVIFQDNAWVVKSMAVVSIPYSRIHTVAAEDSASLLTGRGFFSSSRIIITTSAGSRVFQFRGADKARIAHNLILRHILDYPHGTGGAREGKAVVSYGRASGERTEALLAEAVRRVSEQEEPVRIPKNVLEEMESLRRYTRAEVLDIPTIRHVAMERAKPALVVWIDNHQQEYGQGLLNGFLAED